MLKKLFMVCKTDNNNFSQFPFLRFLQKIKKLHPLSDKFSYELNNKYSIYSYCQIIFRNIQVLDVNVNILTIF